MITTVTTATVTTVATVGLTAAISIAAVVSLIFFLTIRELASAGGSAASLRIARFFGTFILPLVTAFVVVIVAKLLW